MAEFPRFDGLVIIYGRFEMAERELATSKKRANASLRREFEHVLRIRRNTIRTILRIRIVLRIRPEERGQKSQRLRCVGGGKSECRANREHAVVVSPSKLEEPCENCGRDEEGRAEREKREKKEGRRRGIR